MFRIANQIRHWLQVSVLACLLHPFSIVAFPHDDVGCQVVDAAGNIKEGASYAWTLRNFTIDTPPPREASVETSRTIRFLLSGPLLQSPVLCQGPTHSPDLYEWQSCNLEDGSSLKNAWLSYSYSFLIEGYLQLNQTWFCERNNKRQGGVFSRF